MYTRSSHKMAQNDVPSTWHHLLAKTAQDDVHHLRHAKKMLELMQQEASIDSDYVTFACTFAQTGAISLSTSMPLAAAKIYGMFCRSIGFGFKNIISMHS